MQMLESLLLESARYLCFKYDKIPIMLHCIYVFVLLMLDLFSVVQMYFSLSITQ
jgi:hypothetical protein